MLIRCDRILRDSSSAAADASSWFGRRARVSPIDVFNDEGKRVVVVGGATRIGAFGSGQFIECIDG
jgi:hypothetical protein